VPAKWNCCYCSSLVPYVTNHSHSFLPLRSNLPQSWDSCVLRSCLTRWHCYGVGSYVRNWRQFYYKFWPINNKNSLKCVIFMYDIFSPIPVAALSKVWFCGRSHAGIVGSNPTAGMNVSCDLCIVRYRSLWRTDHSNYRVWCVWVCCRNLTRDMACSHLHSRAIRESYFPDSNRITRSFGPTIVELLPQLTIISNSFS